MYSAPSFQLTLFGGQSIVGPDGLPLTGQAVQRHRLALLALLALSNGRRLSREKLMGYLWPERETEHARQLLNQAVYSVRKALRDDVILSEGDHLRFNPDVVRVDVADFESAITEGDHAEAVRLYSGPLLDGFALGDAPEFEWWADRERERLAGARARAVEALAEAAARAGDLACAVEWWKARAAQDPYDSRVAVRLMEVLEASGNRAGALQHAKVHAALLEMEFDAAPSSDVFALAERLRNAPPDARQASERAAERVAEAAVAAELAPPREAPARAPGEPIEPPGVDSLAAPGIGNRDPRSRRTRLIGYASTALAVTAVGLFALSARAPHDDAPPARANVSRPASIAVLPLTNLSADAGDASLADGMTEELIATLAKLGRLRVIGSTSVFALRDQHLDARRIADTLHVALLIEGDVQKSGTRVRVRVRLVDPRDGGMRWSQSYDRELGDVFLVEDDIARAVARELGMRVASAQNEPDGTRNIAAHELYLRGSDPVLLRSDSGTRTALAYFHQALDLDTTYAAAYAGLARTYLRQALGNAGAGSRSNWLALAERNAAKALALDDSLADAHGAMSLVRMAKFDLASAESSLARAVELEPDQANFHEWFVRLYVVWGRPADALREARRALELDPLSPSANAELARALLAGDRADEALAQLRTVAALRPPLLRANILAAQCYMKKGAWHQAIAVLRPQVDGGGPTALAHLGYALARAGQRDAALRIRDTLVDRWRRDTGGPLQVALVSAGLGDSADAFAWLDRAIAAGWIDADLTAPLFDTLRREPRFEQVRERQRRSRQ